MNLIKLFLQCAPLLITLELISCDPSKSEKNSYTFPEGIGDAVVNTEETDSAINVRIMEDSLSQADDLFFDDKNYKAAIDIYIKYADKMDAERLCTLAMMYQRGQGIKQDLTKSLALLHKAAEKGSSTAKNNIGFAYYKGNGVKKDYAKAMKWYLESIHDSTGIGMSNIGVMYLHGDGVEQNCSEAVSWFTRSANNGCTLGMGHLAGAYLHGYCGMKKDTATAIKWLEKQRERGDSEVVAEIEKLKLSFK